MNRAQLDFVIRDLRRRFMPYRQHHAGTALDKITAKTEDPFKVLVSTILSQRTRDEITETASESLFSRYENANALARAPIAEVRQLIRPVGFYAQKAARIKEVSRIIVENYGGRVPPEYDELVKLPQVGPKTANCVLVYGFGIPRIPVDTHVHRITNRLGLVKTRKPEDTEAVLMRKVPREYWIDLNGLLVRFGQKVCRPIGPRCSECNFTRFCMYYREYVR